MKTTYRHILVLHAKTDVEDFERRVRTSGEYLLANETIEINDVSMTFFFFIEVHRFKKV